MDNKRKALEAIHLVCQAVKKNPNAILAHEVRDNTDPDVALVNLLSKLASLADEK